MTVRPGPIPAQAEIETTLAGYEQRLSVIRQRLDDYHPDVQRRAATDTCHDAARACRWAGEWLAGVNDGMYAGPRGPFTDLDGFRRFYAADHVRDALHYLLVSEAYAGLRPLDSDDPESARTLDPWRITEDNSST